MLFILSEVEGSRPMKNMSFRQLFVSTILVLLNSAEGALTEERSILVPPPSNASVYEQKFSSLPVPVRMRLLIHGLRTAPLHPTIWGENVIDETDSRNIIPMKRYYFRDSESENFRLEQVTFDFTFEKTKVKSMKNSPCLMTPLLDIEFGGVYEREDAAERPSADRSYVVRISASPLFQSGIWFRSRTDYILLAPGRDVRVPTGEPLHLDMKVSGEKTSVFLGDSLFAEIPGDFRKGLLNLRTDWRPLSASLLQVKASLYDGRLHVPVNESGLVSTE